GGWGDFYRRRCPRVENDRAVARRYGGGWRGGDGGVDRDDARAESRLSDGAGAVERHGGETSGESAGAAQSRTGAGDGGADGGGDGGISGGDRVAAGACVCAA